VRDHLLAFLASALAVVWGHAALASPMVGAPLEQASSMAIQTLVVLALGCLTSGALWSRAPTVFATPRREVLAGVWLAAGLVGLLLWNERATFAQLHGYPEALLILAPTALVLHSQISFVLFLTAHGAVIALALALRPSGGVALAFALLSAALMASLAERSASERFPLRAREQSARGGARTLRGAAVPLIALLLAFVGFSASKPQADAATTEDWIRWLKSGRASKRGGYQVGGLGGTTGPKGPRGPGGHVKPPGPAPAPEAVAPKEGPARIGFSRDVKFGDLSGGDRSIAFYARVRTEYGSPIDPVTFRPYWTGGALSRYAEGRWEAAPGETLQRPPRLEDPGAGTLIEQQIVLEGAGQRALFALYPPVWSDLEAVLLDGEGCLRRAPDANAARYSVTSRLPSRRRLERNPIASSDRRYLEVPLELAVSPVFEDIVNEAQEAGSTPLVQIYATQRILSERYLYTLRPGIPEGADPTLAFLAGGKGYCQHFASAMILLLRAQGIPARMAVGYAGGEWRKKGGFYVVRQKHAHAWVEVPFEGRGWIVFDPASQALAREPELGPVPTESPDIDPGTTGPRPQPSEAPAPSGTPSERPDPDSSPSQPAASPAPLRPSPSVAPRPSPGEQPDSSPSRPRPSPSASPGRTPPPGGAVRPSPTPGPRAEDVDPFQRIWTHAEGKVGSAPPPPPPSPAPGASPRPGGRPGGGPGGKPGAERPDSPGGPGGRSPRPIPENLARDSAQFALGSLVRDVAWGLGALLAVALGIAAYRAWRRRRSEAKEALEEAPSALRYGADELGGGGGPTLEELHAANAVVSVYLKVLKGLAKRGSPRQPSETARELARRLDLTSLHALTELFERARYGQRGLPPDALAEAERLEAEVREALAD
jgi:transglutaminase-like putative cysteine protease